MEISQSTRQFKYNGVVLQDPGPAYSLEQVREFYSTLYPEIINAAIEGPTIAGAKTVYEFRRAVGTKGADDTQARLERLIARRAERAKAATKPLRTKTAEALHRTVADVTSTSRWHRLDTCPTNPVLPPSHAIALLP